MTWSGVQGHDDIVEQFRRSLARGRLASTFLFVGPAGIGKKRFALGLAQALLCETNPAAALEACGQCSGCRQVGAQTHPDLLLVSRPPDKAIIPVETFIGDRDHRMQEGLCHDIALKPMRGGRRVAIIDDADYLNAEGANCLLKTLEEPPPRSVMILIASSQQTQLPTIRSRCQIVRFAPLAEETVARLLAEHSELSGAVSTAELARQSGGSLAKALELADDDLQEFRGQLLDWLAALPLCAPVLGKSIGQFVDEAGKEAPPRRARMKQIVGFAAEFYRQLARTLCGAAAEGDARLQAAVDRAARQWPFGAEAATACLLRCLQTGAHIDSNANQATLLECWVDDLNRLASGARPSLSN